MSALIGGGLPSIWQLPDKHKFQPAFVMHDAGHDAIDIFLGKKVISEVSTQEYPLEYPLFVQTQLDKLKLAFDRTFNRDRAVKDFVGRIDRELRSQCLRLCTSRFDEVQTWLFYKIVRFYSRIKYGC